MGVPNTKEAITVAFIMAFPTITVHAGKYYKELIDSGAAISLLHGIQLISTLITVLRPLYSPQQQN